MSWGRGGRRRRRTGRARSLVGAAAAVLAFPVASFGTPPPPAWAETTGPALAHVPVATAPYGQPIPISLTSTCALGAACSARLHYRTTTAGSIPPVLVTGVGFQVVDLSGTATTVDGQDAVTWSGAIPGTAATTAGIDYFLEADQNGAVTRFPGTTYTDGSPPAGTYKHIHVVSPPLVNHVPVPFAVADQPITIDAQVSCSSGSCQATLWYRRTPATLDANLGWSSTSMQAQGPGTSLGGAAVLSTYRAQVPAASVDTTGADYYLHITDGHTQAFSPGTPYVGYYAPTDGTHSRAATYHVHVLEPPRLVHAAVTTAPYRTDIPVSARTNCPSERTCQATLSYRTTPPGVLGTAAFSSTAMTVTRTIGAAGVDAIAVDGVIPAGVADTRGVDYFFSVTDGTTTSWWPGTSAADGPGVWVDGTRVVYQHIRVQEPPHLVHLPPTVAQPFVDFTVETALTCATETCSVTLHYTSTPGTPNTYQSVAMTRTTVSPSTSASRAEVWRATVPAAQVTTRGLAYYLTATDGWTNTAAPGTFYWGAYAAVDGSNPAPGTARFVVRVVDPPHPVHVPVGAAHTGEPATVEARSNCAASCAATLHWRVTGQAWQVTAMAGSPPVPLAYGNDLVTYAATIPGSQVTPAGLEYRIAVTDGYVSESTPTYPVAVTDRPVPRIGTATVAFDIGGTLSSFPCEGCNTSFGGTGTASGAVRAHVEGTAYDAAFTVPNGLVTGSATYTEPGATFCPAFGFAVGTATFGGTATGVVRRSTAPTVPGTVTALTVQVGLSYNRVGAVAVVEVTGGTATLSFSFPDTGTGSLTTAVAGAGLGAFVVAAEEAVARCAAPGSLPYRIVGGMGVGLS